MRFNFEKLCGKVNCTWVVWDACIINMHCMVHCNCVENYSLKRESREKELYIQKQRKWETTNGRNVGKLRKKIHEG